MIKNFYRKTTQAFDVYVTQNKAPQTLEGTMSVMFKKNLTDLDSDAVIDVDAIDYDMEKARFVLTVENTTIDAGLYYYQFKWTTSDGQVYLFPQGTVNVLQGVYE